MGSRHGAPRPTIYDVAREAGVSKSLVSLVLNDSELVSDGKREAVRAAIEKLGYRRSRAASNLAAERTHTVGLVIDDFSNPSFVEVLAGVRTVLGPRGFRVAVQENYTLGGVFVNAVEGFLDAQVDALLIAAEMSHDLPRPGVPTVIEGTRLNVAEGADRVFGDQAHGVALAFGHLVELGHRAIGHVTGVGGAARHRLDAYLRAVEGLGEPARHAGERNPTNEEGGYAGGVELLRRHPEVTAILAANDTMALGVRAALREAGRSVPGDVSLVGYDNSQLARSRFLDLTTVDNRGFDVGVACGEALLRRMGDPSLPVEEVVVPARLVVRSSSGPPPTSA
ncbi:MAG TPA: LacI family DNA-binding transcriptional regulator [Arachnia sp.]|jgi:DNA-binding LacI/PurR family transcriptional regulator|nr:LacI family DNA-binding transcriptional regulator [Arachnia sp.]